jgi:hypothetical protein
MMWRAASGGFAGPGMAAPRRGGETLAEKETRLTVLQSQLDAATAADLQAQYSGNVDFKLGQVARKIGIEYDELQREILGARRILAFQQKQKQEQEQKAQAAYNQYKEWNDYLALQAEANKAFADYRAALRALALAEDAIDWDQIARPATLGGFGTWLYAKGGTSVLKYLNSRLGIPCEKGKDFKEVAKEMRDFVASKSGAGNSNHDRLLAEGLYKEFPKFFASSISAAAPGGPKTGGARRAPRRTPRPSPRR